MAVCLKHHPQGEPAAFSFHAGEAWQLVRRKVLAKETWRLWQQAKAAAPGLDAESVHDARVALRRVRLALRIGGPWPGDPAACLQTLRDLAGQLAPVREWDILMQRVSGFALHGRSTTPAARSLLDKMVAHRNRLVEQVLPALRSAKWQDLVLELAQAATPEPTGKPSSGAAARAGRVLKKLAKKTAGKACRPIPRMTSQELHRLRIACRRLRYACEFFAPLFSRKLKKYLCAWTDLQARLGACQDDAACIALLENLVASSERFPTTLEEGLLIMVLIRRAQEESRQARWECERQRAKLRRRLQRFRRYVSV